MHQTARVSTEMVCPTLVARQVEWAGLQTALDGIGERVGALWALLGEAGIGKSRLVSELMAAAAARGIPVLVGRAVDATTPVPHRPLFEALAGWARQGGAEGHPELARFRETLAPVVPEWRPAVEPAFRASPMELGEALLRLLAGIAGERGCVVVLEDLHWADPDTAAVLESVGDNISGSGFLCVATARTDLPTDGLRVIRALAERRAASVAELRRLDAQELAEMVRRCLGTDGPSVAVDELVGRVSDGLPLRGEELRASAIAARSRSAASCCRRRTAS
jgi:predicted ATPase